MNPIAAIWHHPGAPPNRQGAGDYPVAIISFVNIPAQTIGVTTRAIVVDTTGHLNAAPTNELEIIDPGVRAVIESAQTARS